VERALMGAPLVYTTARARRQAERLLPGRVVENVIAEQILAGNVLSYPTGGVVFDARRRWAAHCERIPGRIRPAPRAWLVTDLQDYIHNRNGRRP
jgi:hypothetical protein